MNKQAPKASGINLVRPSEEAPPPARKPASRGKASPLAEWNNLDPTTRIPVKEGAPLSFFVPNNLGLKIQSIILETRRRGPIEGVETLAEFFSLAAYDFLTPILKKRGELFPEPHRLAPGKSVRGTIPKEDMYRVLIKTHPLIAGQVRGFLAEAQMKGGIKGVAAMWEFFSDAATPIVERILSKQEIPMIEKRNS